MNGLSRPQARLHIGVEDSPRSTCGLADFLDDPDSLLEADAPAGRWRVLFRGQYAPGASADSVRSSLARLFQVEQDQLEPMFSHQVVTVRSRLSHGEALRYQSAMNDVGAIAELSQDLEEADASPAVSWIEPDTAAERLGVVVEHVRCPRCEYEQMAALRCRRCQLDFGRHAEQLRRAELRQDLHRAAGNLARSGADVDARFHAVDRVPHAGLPRRGFAAAADWVLLAGTVTAVQALFPGVVDALGGLLGAAMLTCGLWITLFQVLSSATAGQLAAGITVRAVDGTPAGWRRLLRAVLWIPVVVSGLGILWPLLAVDHRPLYERWSGTTTALDPGIAFRPTPSLPG